jgi:glycosyltransferase involved in cell wall biosynthesis
MKILTLCYEYPPVGGGGGRVAAAVAEGLAARGHEVAVVTAGMSNLPRQTMINGVQVHRPRSFRKRQERCTVFEMGLYLITSFSKALWIAWTGKIDVIHAHFIVPTGILAFAVSMLSRKPYVLTAHLGDVPGGVPEQTNGLFAIVKPIAKLLVKKASDITAVSTFVSDLVFESFGRIPKRILNGIKLDDQPKDIIKHEVLTFIMVGRMSVQKNPLLALEALARVPTDVPWHLHLVGDGPLLGQIREFVSKHGLHEHVTFHGWVESAKVQQLLRESDVMLMPSLSEGLPVAAIEAMKYGVAIVGGPIPGLKDVLVHEKTGLIADLDVESFYSAIERFASDLLLLERMRIGSIEHVRMFDLKSTIVSYENSCEAASKPSCMIDAQ